MTLAQAASMLRQGPADDPQGWKQEGKDLLRAVTGGAIVGMPLLYTMEMWWRGMALSEWHLLALLAGVLVLNFLFSLTSGFREEYSVPEAISESVTSVGLGILFSTLILMVIGELGPGASPAEKAGKILLEAAPISIGVSFANAQLRGKSRTGDDGEEGGSERKKPDGDPERLQLQEDLRDAGATLAGATVFALNVAPTEEILMIAARLSPIQLLVLLGVAALLCYVILFASGFEEHHVHVPSVFQHPTAETAMTCALSLCVAFALVATIGPREAMSHPTAVVANTVVLGLPAIIGGAAGRLIV